MNSPSFAPTPAEWATSVMNDLSVDDRQTVFDMWRAIRMADQSGLQRAQRTGAALSRSPVGHVSDTG
jgi:hypothetical protein